MACLQAQSPGNSGAAASSAPAAAKHVSYTPGDLQWGDAPPSLPPGAKAAMLSGDPGKAGPFTIRLKTPANYKIPPHTHPTTERVTVISGTAKFGMGTKIDEGLAKQMPAGSYIALPAGMAHYAMMMTADTVVQVDSEGPFEINYVDPKDDPRKK